MEKRFIIRFVYADGVSDYVYIDAKHFFDAVSYAKQFSIRSRVTITSVSTTDDLF